MREKSEWLEKRREETRKIKEYSNGEYPYPGGQLEIDTSELVKLDANEDFFIPQVSYQK